MTQTDATDAAVGRAVFPVTAAFVVGPRSPG
jgi:hypothetical protein